MISEGEIEDLIKRLQLEAKRHRDHLRLLNEGNQGASFDNGYVLGRAHGLEAAIDAISDVLWPTLADD